MSIYSTKKIVRQSIGQATKGKNVKHRNINANINNHEALALLTLQQQG